MTTTSEPPYHKPILFGAGIVVTFFLVGGLILLISRPPQGHPVALLPLPTQPLLVVDIGGAVHSPGVVQLPPGSRLQDAVDAAGGLLPDANRDSVNLAAPLTDGSTITIPFIPTPAPTSLPGQRSPEIILPEISPTPGLIPINTATQAELESLPEIGPSTARSIIAYREEHGPFKDIEQLIDVPGIGPATLNAIRDLITLNP